MACFWGYHEAQVTAAILGMLALALVLLFRCARYLRRWGRAIRIMATALATVLAMMVIYDSEVYDRRSTASLAAETAGVMKSIVQENQRYAATHGGSFARRLSELDDREVVESAHTITYRPIESQGPVVRHYTLRALPVGRWWMRLYVDESGVIRWSDNGPAGPKSHPWGSE